MSALALVAVLVVAALLYRNLSDRFAPETTGSSAPESQSQAAADKPSAVSEGNNSAENSSAAQDLAPAEQLAADFVVLDMDNTQVRLSDHFGKPLVVNFWASWCGPCCRELPAFDAAAEQYAGTVEFMMVNLTDGYSETVSSVQSFLEENGYTFPVYFDTNEDASRAYNIYSIPLTVFIRADGTVLDTHIGSMDETTLQNYLTQLSA